MKIKKQPSDNSLSIHLSKWILEELNKIDDTISDSSSDDDVLLVCYARRKVMFELAYGVMDYENK